MESLSIKEFPIGMPYIFKKVNAIAPPIIISSTLSNKLFIRGILSAILAPPKITKNGFLGNSRAFEK
jgi:hypothetical protein